MASKWRVRRLARISISLAIHVIFSPLRAFAGDPNAAPTIGIEDAVRIAAAHAPIVRSAAAQTAVAAANVTVAESPRYPTFSLSGQGQAYSRSATVVVNGVRADNDARLLTAGASVQGSWMVYDFGRTARQVASSQSSLTGSNRDVAAARCEAAGVAALAFFELLFQQDSVRAATSMFELRQRYLDETEALATAGMISPIHAQRAKIALEAARIDVHAAEGASRIAMSGLATALAWDPLTPISIRTPASFEANDDPGPSGDVAVRESYSIAALRARVDAARADADAQKAARYPVINFVAEADVGYAREPARDLSTPSLQGAALLSAGVPIFDASINGRIDGARAAAASAAVELQRQVDAVRAEAVQSALSVSRTQSLLSQSEQLVAAAEANLEALEMRYRNGLSSPLDMLDAQSVLAGAKLDVLRTTRALNAAKVRLLVATGAILRLASSGDLNGNR